MRTSEEILEELEAYRESLRGATALPDSLLIVDLQFFADSVRDLKQELRTAQAIERAEQ